MQEAQDAKAVQEQNAKHAKVRKPLTPRLQYAPDDFDTIDEFGAPSGRLALRASRDRQRRLHPAKSKEVRNHLENLGFSGWLRDCCAQIYGHQLVFAFYFL